TNFLIADCTSNYDSRHSSSSSPPSSLIHGNQGRTFSLTPNGKKNHFYDLLFPSLSSPLLPSPPSSPSFCFYISLSPPHPRTIPSSSPPPPLPSFLSPSLPIIPYSFPLTSSSLPPISCFLPLLSFLSLPSPPPPHPPFPLPLVTFPPPLPIHPH